jgi:hypothetical protein
MITSRVTAAMNGESIGGHAAFFQESQTQVRSSLRFSQ